MDDGAAVRAEWRAEEEQWSRAAFEHWEHGRRLDDVLRDSMQRGDVVTFAFPSHRWTGAVIGVGPDVARLRTADTCVDVRLAAAAPFVLRVRPGAPMDLEGTVTTLTFAARMRELDDTTVGMGTPVGLLEGTLRVGRGQVRITDRDDRLAYVPTESVWWVRPVDD